MLGAVQARVMSRDNGLPLLVGDLNARVWDPVALASTTNTETLVYETLTDGTVNAQGRTILQVCKDSECVVVNHLKHNNRQFGGGLSFRKRTWVSELDICIAALKALPYIKELTIENGLQLPSNHAPLTLNLDLTNNKHQLYTAVTRSADLGQYWTPSESRTRRGLPIHRVNKTAFRAIMNEQQPPVDPITEQSLENTVTSLNTTLNEAAKTAK